MQKLVVTLETVTPLFLGGADSEPELRPPSFRGMMRYWWRALVGGTLGIKEMELKEKEKEVWGDSQSGSPIVVNIKQPQKLSPPKLWLDYPKRNINSDYFFWSVQRRKYIPPRQSFNLQLWIRPGSSGSFETLWQTYASLWLLVQLGGIGSRSRRAAGSLRFVPPLTEMPYDFSNFMLSATTPKQLAEALSHNIKYLSAELSRMYSVTSSPQPSKDFDVLHPQLCKIWVVTADVPWTSWEGAVEGIGSAMRNFRKNEDDSKKIRKWKGGDPPDTIQTAIFGLPLPFKNSGIVNSRDHNRRASPLHLHVSRLNDDSYVGVLTLFKSNFLPRNDSLKLSSSKVRDKVEAPSNFYLIEKFATTSFTNHWEVQL